MWYDTTTATAGYSSSYTPGVTYVLCTQSSFPTVLQVVERVTEKLLKRDMCAGLAALTAVALSLVPEGCHAVSIHSNHPTKNNQDSTTL